MGKRSRRELEKSDQKDGQSDGQSSSKKISKKMPKSSDSSLKLTISKLESIEHAMINLARDFQTIINSYSDITNDDGGDEAVKHFINKPRIKLAREIKIAYEDGKLPLIDKIIEFKGITGGNQVDESLPEQFLFDIDSDIAKRTKKKVKLDDSKGNKKEKRIWPPALPDITDKLLENRVFTHKSLINRKSHLTKNEQLQQHNERLEFLGDAVLNFVATNIVYNSFPDADEGVLTTRRSLLVCNDTISQWSKVYGLDKRLSSHIPADVFNSTDSNKLSKTIADTFESYIGGLYSDPNRGPLVVQNWLNDLFLPTIENYSKRKSDDEEINKDAKQLLYVQIGTYESSPEYITVKEPAKVDGDFTVECRMSGEVLGVGVAKNTKNAGLKAAMMALQNESVIEKYAEIRRRTPKVVKGEDEKEVFIPKQKKTASPKPPTSFKDELYSKIGSALLRPKYSTEHVHGIFNSIVKMEDDVLGKGSSTTKKESEQKAAQQALQSKSLNKWVERRKELEKAQAL